MSYHCSVTCRFGYIECCYNCPEPEGICRDDGATCHRIKRGDLIETCSDAKLVVSPNDIESWVLFPEECERIGVEIRERSST